MSVQLDQARPRHAPRSAGENEASLVCELLSAAARLKASDVLLVTDLPAVVYCAGVWRPLNERKLSPADIWRCLDGMMNAEQRGRFERERDLDFAFDEPGLGRYRVNAHFQKNQPAAALRAIPAAIPKFDQLGLPQEILRLAGFPSGLVLVTGGTGQGKSTTLAAIIDHINRHRSDHVITIEDPIEFDFVSGRSVIEQREIGSDSPSFAGALRHVLRQRPDVILIGEMRDLETISTALTAAETGHLVFASMHTASASQTIARIIDVFPAAQQAQVRVQFAASIRAILCQHLLRDAGGGGVLPATELLFATIAVRRAIRENETHLIYSMIETGRRHGMHTLEQSLAGLVGDGKIEAQTAFERTSNPTRLEKLLGISFDMELSGGAGPTEGRIPWSETV